MITPAVRHVIVPPARVFPAWANPDERRHRAVAGNDFLDARRSAAAHLGDATQPQKER
jgi:uncharacterized protein YndB with AHSA1/START domain